MMIFESSPPSTFFVRLSSAVPPTVAVAFGIVVHLAGFVPSYFLGPEIVVFVGRQKW